MDTKERTTPEREAARIVASALRQDAASQDRGDFDSIGERYDDVYAEVLTVCSAYPDRVATGFTFWDWWVDARNHAWQYYEGIGCDDWPRLARHVAASVEAGMPVTEPVLVRHIELARRPGSLPDSNGSSAGSVVTMPNFPMQPSATRCARRGG
jgi:hypothetical protein